MIAVRAHGAERAQGWVVRARDSALCMYNTTEAEWPSRCKTLAHFESLLHHTHDEKNFALIIMYMHDRVSSLGFVTSAAFVHTWVRFESMLSKMPRPASCAC